MREFFPTALIIKTVVGFQAHELLWALLPDVCISLVLKKRLVILLSLLFLGNLNDFSCLYTKPG